MYYLYFIYNLLSGGSTANAECDECECDLYYPVEHYHCERCHYDLCMSCANEKMTTKYDDDAAEFAEEEEEEEVICCKYNEMKTGLILILILEIVQILTIPFGLMFSLGQIVNERSNVDLYAYLIMMMYAAFGITALVIIIMIAKYKCCSKDTVESRTKVLTSLKVMLIRDLIVAIFWLFVWAFASLSVSRKKYIYQVFIPQKVIILVLTVFWYSSVKEWVHAKQDYDENMEKVRLYKQSLKK